MGRLRSRVREVFAQLGRMLRFAAPLAPDEALNRTVWAGLGLVFTSGVGVVGYVLIDDFAPFDALYQTLLTLTTVGFQEVHPLSRAARAFTIFLMVFGVGIVLYLLTAIATLVLEGELYRDIKERRERRMIGNLNGHTIFIGAGSMGSMVAERLVAQGQDLVVIERDANAVARARDRGWTVLAGDGDSIENLQQAGIVRARRLYVMTGDDGANTIATYQARQQNPDIWIMTRANRPGSEGAMETVGATEVVSLSGLLAGAVADSALNGAETRS